MKKANSDIYPHANTIISIEESKLLKDFEYEILYNSKGLNEALEELNDINYFHSYENAEPYNYKQMLEGVMNSTFLLLKELAPNQNIWRLFALYYDIHNMKLVVKERLLGKRLDSLAIKYGSYQLNTIRSAAVREKDNILNNEILTTGFFKALGSETMYDIDFILDKTYCEALRSIAKSLGKASILNFVIERIDLYNISAYFQMHGVGLSDSFFIKAFSDKGTYGIEAWKKHLADPENGRNPETAFSLWLKYSNIWQMAENRNQLFSELDVLIDNYLIEKTKNAKLISFGIEPICAYFFNKFIEIKNVRILLSGKEHKYKTEKIKERMRIPYEL